LDKALHSNGYQYGYSLPTPQLPNPINIIMVYAQRVFPLDYCLFLLVVLYFVYSSMAGIRRVGIRCCWIKLFKVRPRRTLPQALLFMCVMLMLIVLSLNVMLFSLAPQYVMYGSQNYRVTLITNWLISTTRPTYNLRIELVKSTTSCSSSDHCTMTRIAVFLNRFFYKVWFFGACYYWGTWLFLVVFMTGLIYSIVRKRKTVVDEEYDSSDDSDEE
ncbi:predicted protein, partial [Nematostella vectensis]